MKLIQVIQNGDEMGLYDISETDCADETLKDVFKEAFDTDEPDEFLEEKGIIRYFLDIESTINLD